MDELKLVAFHEAGHAFMAYLTDLEFESVSIEPDNDSDGRVSFAPIPDWYDPEYNYDSATTERMTADVMTTLAGPIAQSIISGEEPDWGRSWKDYDYITDFAVRLSADEKSTNRFLEEKREGARGILEEHWPTIEAIAGELIKKRTLSFEEFLKIVEPDEEEDEHGEG